MTTGRPAAAHTCAMPLPMVPAPTMPIDSIMVIAPLFEY
jgi:hypothetical protein